MKNIKVTWEEVVRHFLRTQSHKCELKGINIEDLTLREAEQVACKFEGIYKKMKPCAQWHFRLIDESLFGLLKAITAPTWEDLSDHSLKIADIAKNVMKRDSHPSTRQKVEELLKLITTDGFDWRIIVQSDGEDHTVLDGVSRAVTMWVHFSQQGFNPFWAYVGN